MREALAFPLAGRPLEQLVRAGGTATVVIEQPSLPIPAARSARGTRRSRRSPTSSTASASQQVTILVAGGLLRRTAPREIGLLVPPEFRRRFSGRVIVHDAEAEDLVDLGVSRQRHAARQPGARRDRPRRHRDRGRDRAARRARPPCSRRAAASRCAPQARCRCSRRAPRRAGGSPSRSSGGSPSVSPITGVSLVAQPAARRRPVRRLPARPARRSSGMLGSRVRRALPVRARPRAPARRSSACRASRRRRPCSAARPRSRTPRRCCAARCFKGIELAEPVDALVIGIPPTTPFMPRERPNPVSAAYLGARPRAAAVAQHAADRAGRHGDPRAPVPAALPAADADALPRALLRPAHRAATSARCATRSRPPRADTRAIADYRAGRACHPLQPFVEWSACDASAHRLGAVLIAGCRDAQSARQLGFVPVHGVSAPRSRWLAAAARSASATCWRRRTSRSSSPANRRRPTDCAARGRRHRDAGADEEVRRPRRGRRCRPRRARRSRVRLPRPERRGQDDDDPHAARPDARDLRRGAACSGCRSRRSVARRSHASARSSRSRAFTRT